VSFVHKADGEDSQAVLDRTLDTAKCIYLDRARQRRCPPLTPEQGAERKAAFGAWTAKVGEGSSTSATHS